MKLLLSGSKLQKFCDIVGNFKHVSEYFTLNFSNDSVYSQGMSGDHCSIYELSIDGDWFDDYEWDEDKDARVFSVSTEILSKVLHTRQPSQFMVIEFFGKPDHLILRFDSIAKNGKNQQFPKEFMLPFIDVDVDQLTIPDVEYDAEFGIGSKALQITNDQLSLFNETLTIHCSEDEIYLRSKGNDGELKVTLFNENCEHITEFAIAEELSLTLDFSIKHFNIFCKFLKVSNNIALGFIESYPMKFEYIMGADDANDADDADDANDADDADDADVSELTNTLKNKMHIDDTKASQIKLVFYLAPKISDD